MSDFAGDWFTTFGRMHLEQNGPGITGTYQMGSQECFIAGQVTGSRFRFKYREPNASGEGWFDLQRYGKFAGRWRPDGAQQWGTWLGQRGFEGIWETSFGPVRLIHEDERVFGFYEGLGSSTIDGQRQGDRLLFRYQEPKAQGEGWFKLSEDEMFFEGQWRPDGTQESAPWVGRRLVPRGGVWLVILEAYWQHTLDEREYAFGNMLREFFARLGHVGVRQRFFTNAAGLAKWCRELMYMPEPIALVLASHGTAEGLIAHGEVIAPGILADNLRYADSLMLLHFSSCMMLEQTPAHDWTKLLRDQLTIPISGYSTTVDWAASALIEFTYLDMILGRNMSPEAAAEQVVKLLAFAGDQVPPSSPYPAAQFRFWQPADQS